MKSIYLSLFFLVWCPFVVLAEEENPVQFCLAKDSEWSTLKHLSLMKDYGVNCATLYVNITSKYNRSYPFGLIEPYIRRGYDVVVTLIFGKLSHTSTSQAVLDQIVRGYYDNDLNIFINALKKSVAKNKTSSKIVIRPLHELDGNWLPWGMYTKGNSVGQAISAVEHVSKIIRAKNTLVKIEINLNRRDGRNKVLGEAEKYIPRLEPLVDMFAISTYNRCGTAVRYKYERSFSYDFRPAYKRLKTFTDKPINVAEVSTSGLCSGNKKLPWFRRMLEDIKNEFPQTKMVTLFFGKKTAGDASNDVDVDWGISSKEQIGFRRLLTNDILKKYQEPGIYKSSFDEIFDVRIRLPWSLNTKLSYPLSEVSNSARNSVTGNEFGRESLLFIIQFKQRLLFPIADSVEFGPVIRLDLVKSVNENMWWNNRFAASLGLGVYGDLPRGVIKWGQWYTELYVEGREYLAPTPRDRYEGGREIRVMGNIGINFGGDWSQ